MPNQERHSDGAQEIGLKEYGPVRFFQVQGLQNMPHLPPL